MAESVIDRTPAQPVLPRVRRADKRRQLAVVVLVLLGAVGYLVYSGLSTTVYYQTVGELQASAGGPGLAGRQVRVLGRVADGSVVREEAGSVVRFVIADEGGRLPVSYKGAVPDIFGPGIEVVVEGKYTPGSGFVADELLAKCPSKFDSAAAR